MEVKRLSAFWATKYLIYYEKTGNRSIELLNVVKHLNVFSLLIPNNVKLCT